MYAAIDVYSYSIFLTERVHAVVSIHTVSEFTIARKPQLMNVTQSVLHCVAITVISLQCVNPDDLTQPRQPPVVQQICMCTPSKVCFSNPEVNMTVSSSQNQVVLSYSARDNNLTS